MGIQEQWILQTDSMLFYYNVNVKPHRRDADPDSLVRESFLEKKAVSWDLKAKQRGPRSVFQQKKEPMWRSSCKKGYDSSKNWEKLRSAESHRVKEDERAEGG